MTSTLSATPSGTFTLGGDLPVVRLGYGAMQITGDGVWGEPKDRDEAIAVLRRAVELGVTFIDTADSYGPNVSEEIIREALHPYADDIVVATKAGLTRTGPGEWVPVGRPAYLKQQVELSLRKLGVDRIDLIQLHRIDPEVPVADQVGAFKELQEQGKVRHIGLSRGHVDQLKEAQKTAEIVSVQNMFNLARPRRRAAARPLHGRGHRASSRGSRSPPASLVKDGGALSELAKQHDATPSQLALAWLLHRSPVMLPIPGHVQRRPPRGQPRCGRASS